MSNWLYATYLTKPLMAKYPDWKIEQDFAFVTHNKSELQYLNRSHITSNETYQRQHLVFDYVIESHAYIEELFTLFDACKGAYDVIWVPSWLEDVHLTRDIAAGATSIYVTKLNMDTYYPATPGTGRHIFIYINQATWYARAISSATVSGDEEILVLDSAITSAHTTANVKFISFLYKTRLDNSALVCNFIAPGLLRTRLSFTEVPKEYS